MRIVHAAKSRSMRARNHQHLAGDLEALTAAFLANQTIIPPQADCLESYHKAHGRQP